MHAPYYSNQEPTLRLNFSPNNLCFEIFTKHELNFGGFESVKIKIDFCCILDQIVVFEKDIIWENMEFDVPVTKPPVHQFASIVAHNMTNGNLSVPANAMLGRLKIYSLSKNVIYKPMLVQQGEFDICAKQERLIKTYDARENLCKKLSSLVNLKSQEVLDGQFTDQMSIQEKQVRITSLIKEVGVHNVFLPRDVKGKLKFDFHRLLANLNTILISQYLQKSQNCVNKDDIIELQQSDPVLKNIIYKVMTEDQVNEKFIVKDQILFKLTLMYGVQIYRLCLPMNLAREVLSILHNYKSAHLGTNNLRLKFRSNFWCWGLENALKSIKNGCLICRLNADKRELAVKGVKRRWQNDITPGKIWQADILYMPTSNEGHRFILTLTERVTSYVCAIPLKTLSVKHVCSALEIFWEMLHDPVTKSAVHFFNLYSFIRW